MNLSSKRKLVCLILLSLILNVIPVNGDWLTRQIDKTENDLFFSETGNLFDSSPYIAVSQTGSTIQSFFKFTTNGVVQSSTVENAYLSLRAPPGVYTNETVTVTVQGITGLLAGGDWSTEAEALISIPVTANLVNVDINELQNGTWFNITVTDIVTELKNQYGWSSSSPIAFRVLADRGADRYAYAFDSHPELSAMLYVEYTPQGPEEYKGYVITPNDPLAPVSMFYAELSGVVNLYVLPETESARSQNWDRYPAPCASFQRMTSSQNYGVVVGDYLYSLLFDDSGTRALKLYQTPLSNFSDWTIVRSITTLASDDWYGFDYDNETNIMHIGYAQISGLKYSNVLLEEPFTHSGLSEPVAGGYSSGSCSQISVLLDTNKNLHISGAIPGPSGSTARSAYIYYNQSSDSWSPSISYAPDASSYYTRLFQLGNYLIQIYAINSPVSHKWRYKDITDLTSSWSTPETLTNTLQNMAYTNAYYLKNYFNESINYRDVIVTIGQKYTAPEYRLGPGLIYLNSSGIPNRLYAIPAWASLGNQTGENKQFNTHFYLDDMVYSTYMSTSGHEIYWANPAYAMEFSHTFYLEVPTPLSNIYLLADYGTITGMASILIPDNAFLPGGYTVTPPINGTPVNPNCIALALTLEDVYACIDAVDPDPVDPSDPTPPGTNYEEILPRFKLRFYIWLIGWVCITSPILAISWKRFPMEYYYGFLLMILTGIALVWYTASV